MVSSRTGTVGTIGLVNFILLLAGSLGLYLARNGS